MTYAAGKGWGKADKQIILSFDPQNRTCPLFNNEAFKFGKQEKNFTGDNLERVTNIIFSRTITRL